MSGPSTTRLPVGSPRLLDARRRQLVAAGGLAFLALAIPSGCDDHIIGQGIPLTTTCTREPALDWENFGDGLVGHWCRGCHSVELREGQRAGAPPGVDFNSYEDVQLWADRISARAVESESMPPAGGLSDTERAQLGEWLRCDVLPSIGQVSGEAPEEGS